MLLGCTWSRAQELPPCTGSRTQSRLKPLRQQLGVSNATRCLKHRATKRVYQTVLEVKAIKQLGLETADSKRLLGLAVFHQQNTAGALGPTPHCPALGTGGCFRLLRPPSPCCVLRPSVLVRPASSVCSEACQQLHCQLPSEPASRGHSPSCERRTAPQAHVPSDTGLSGQTLWLAGPLQRQEAEADASGPRGGAGRAAGRQCASRAECRQGSAPRSLHSSTCLRLRDRHDRFPGARKPTGAPGCKQGLTRSSG